MPLSEQEQRLLDEMERNLYHHEADDVAKVGSRGRASYTAIALAIIGGVLGIVLLIVGALLGFAPPRRFTVARDADGATRRPSFMDTLGERWEQRRDPED
jgi:hypothetical protein